MKKLLILSAFLAAGAFAGGPAFAKDLGDVSGPAAGKPVKPSTVVQKDNPNIPDMVPSSLPGPSGAAAGAPGIEGKKGTQSGKEGKKPPAKIGQR